MSSAPEPAPFATRARDTALVLFIAFLFLIPTIAVASVTAACVAIPLYLLYTKPEAYTPLVDVLFSIFLWWLAFVSGGWWQDAKAARRANEKWLPAAEGVIQRLMTLRANVRQFAMRTESHCDETICELPELKAPELSAVRVKMRAECRASKERLDDIANQLEDAVADWKRFIIANCHGDECGRISDAIEQREQRLATNTETLRIASEQATRPHNADKGDA